MERIDQIGVIVRPMAPPTLLYEASAKQGAQNHQHCRWTGDLSGTRCRDANGEKRSRTA